MIELGRRGRAGGDDSAPVLRDGAVVAVLRPGGTPDAARVTIGDQEWVFARVDGELTARRVDEAGGTARMRASRTGPRPAGWTVDLDGSQLESRPLSGIRGTHAYVDGAGRRVAESGSSGFWSPRLRLTADDALPLEQQVFLLWVEGVLARYASDGGVMIAADASDGGADGDGGGGGD